MYDTIIIGSGFGGCFIADVLVRSGERVVMIERGDWVPRDEERNWGPDGAGLLTSFFSTETPYEVQGARGRTITGAFNCVGGPSVFYGGASLRLRECDFTPGVGITRDSNARWPFDYDELEPYYTLAEQMLDVAGETGKDPTEPPRSAPYPQRAMALTETSGLIAHAAEELGLRPFSLPLAINYGHADGRTACIACATCDGFACAIGAKNDLAVTIIPRLVRLGLELRERTVAVRLVERDRQVVGVQCVDARTGASELVRGKRIVLSAGAMASPHLLLASGLDALNPGGHTIGRYLLRHHNGLVLGVFREPPGKPERFHKQVAIHDYYNGHPRVAWPPGKLGGLQQLSTPTASIVRAYVPGGLHYPLMPVLRRVTGLLVLSEDQPSYDNRIWLERGRSDRFGLPQLVVQHRYSDRDIAASSALAREAKRILKQAGARIFWTHHLPSYSHAVGTVRAGVDSGTSALDAYCRFRGIDNLYVVDGSFMPSSGGVNPSLTIAANALRVGFHLAGAARPAGRPGIAESRSSSLAASTI